MSAILLAIGCCPPPAAAAPAPATITTRFQQLTLAPEGEGQEAMLWAAIDMGDESSFDVVNYTVDYSGITAFAEVELGEVFGSVGLGSSLPSTGGYASNGSSAAPSDDGCRATGTTFVCHVQAYLDDVSSLVGLGYFGVTPKAGATVGASGTVRVTASVGTGPESTSESLVRIGEGINLAAAQTGPVEARPGTIAEVSGRIQNAGSTVADGITLFAALGADRLTGNRYRNCRYGEVIVCHFDTTLQPGTTYEFAEPMGIGIPDDAIEGSMVETELFWTSTTEWEDLTASWPEEVLDEVFGDGQPGDDGELALTEVAAAAAGEPQIELDYTNNTAEVTITVTDGAAADFAAIGDRVEAKPGSQVVVRAGMANNGPGRLYPELFANNQVVFEVRLPSHTYAEGGDAPCYWKDESMLLCVNESALEPGERQVYRLDVRVEKKPTTEGAVQVWELSDTGNKGNDLAPIVVTVPDDGESLPITGPGGLLTAGIVLVLLGFLIHRRTRSRDDRASI